jgi:hypothetical protein
MHPRWSRLDVYQHVGQGVKNDAAQLVADLVAKR